MSKPRPDKRTQIAKVRNIGIIAHIDAGKTTLTERILFYTHKIHRMGEVHDGAATMDYMPEEQQRGITITAACTSCEWRGRRINLIDTPGHVDFTIEVERCLRVLDGAVGVFCAVGGVEPQSETVWRQSERHHVPKLAFINKLDRPGADFSGVLEQMRARLGAKPVALTVPLGEGPGFEAVIDVLAMRRLTFDAAEQGGKVDAWELTSDETAYAQPWRDRLLEALAEEDEAILEAYLGGQEVPETILREALRRATVSRRLTPAFAGAALRNIGVQPVLDAIAQYLPSPLDVPPPEGHDPVSGQRTHFDVSAAAPFSALAFKVSMDSGRRLTWLRIYSGTLAAGEAVYNATRAGSAAVAGGAGPADERAARLFRLHADHKEKLDEAFAGDIVAVAGLKDARTGDTLAHRDRPILLERIEGYAPVISLALEPRGGDETDRLTLALGHYLAEDPTLALSVDEATGQYILSGMGELHLEVILERLRREHGLHPRSGRPQVLRQETVSRLGQGQAEFHRLLGETMQHGWVAVSVEPRERGAGREVAVGFDRDGWPEPFWRAAAEGLEDGLQSGVLEGHPVTDVRVTILELRRREGESTAVGFRMAASMALRQALADAGPLLLEPLMDVEVAVPGEFVGEVVGLLGAKGARIENLFDRPGGLSGHDGAKVVQAVAPMRRLFGFSTDLRSATQGRAGLSMRFARFDVSA